VTSANAVPGDFDSVHLFGYLTGSYK
jgi:hypothetical protein